MTKLTSLQDTQFDPKTVLTVGTFDGVHAGHRALLQQLVDQAKATECRSVVVTFDPHPREILQPGDQGIRLLTTPSERADLLSELGIDMMVVIPFNRDFSLMNSEEFIEEVIVRKIGLQTFIIGYDHHFGHNRKGDSTTLKALGEKLGFDVIIVEAREVNDHIVSSTSVRKSLSEQGDTNIVKQLLGRPYQLSGLVEHGDARGRTLGFPTANIKPFDNRKVIPKNGVYAVYVDTPDGRYKGVMNIGTRPTFTTEIDVRLEVHIIDFDKMLYGKAITVHFDSRIRDEVKFEHLEALQLQLERDRQIAIQRLN